MKKIVCAVLVTLFLFTLLASAFAHEQDHEQEGESKTGFFLGGGPVAGYETNQIKRFGGGAATRIGYRFLEDLSVYLESDVFFTTKWGATFTIATTVATFSYSVYENLYGYFGAGYELMHASPGASMGGVSYNFSKNWSGWTATAGIGYDFWIKRVTISPEVGLNYARIAAANFYTPTARVIVAYHF